MKINLDSLNEYKKDIVKVENSINLVAQLLEKYKEYFSAVNILYSDYYNDNTYDTFWAGLEFSIRGTALELELEPDEMFLDILSFKELSLIDSEDPAWLKKNKTTKHHDFPSFPIEEFNNDLLVVEKLLSNHPDQLMINDIHISFD